MVQVHLETLQQAERFMQIISRRPDLAGLHLYITYDGDRSISIDTDPGNGYPPSLLHSMRETFVSFIQEDLLHNWLVTIIRDKFFYRDEAECDQIAELAIMLMQEDNKKNQAFWSELKFKIHHGLVSVLERKVSFSFPSFLTFRMKGILDKLSAFVEDAIDEYKMEQDYQSFIHLLRTHLLNNKPKLEKLYLKQHHSFEFYRDDMMVMTRSEVNGYVDRKMFADYPMYIDSHVLAPLICIAPEQLIIYCMEEAHPLISTIERIFEERVSVLPLCQLESQK